MRRNKRTKGERRNKNKVKKEQKREKRIRSKQEKGITLVALVVTIIILLILAGVTLNGALSENGLFQRAKKAVNEYKKAEEVESNAIEEIGDEIDKITFDYNDYVGAYVEGYKPNEDGTCTINATASGWNEFKESNAKDEDKTNAQAANTNIDKATGDQTFDTDTSLKWRIWDYNKITNTIRLISDKPTETKLTLKGANGYNNGVWAINEICRKCYGNTDIGATATSLKRTDIQKVSTYDYTQYKHNNGNGYTDLGEVKGNDTDSTIQFGETKTYDIYHSYPTMWRDHDKDWKYGKNGSTEDKECTNWENEYEGTGLLSGTADIEKTFKQSYYQHNYLEEEFINNKYYDLLFKNGDSSSNLKSYWLATRCVACFENYCDLEVCLAEPTEEGCHLTATSGMGSNRRKVCTTVFLFAL